MRTGSWKRHTVSVSTVCATGLLERHVVVALFFFIFDHRLSFDNFAVLDEKGSDVNVYPVHDYLAVTLEGVCEREKGENKMQGGHDCLSNGKVVYHN
jgi:hypothetical protein